MASEADRQIAGRYTVQSVARALRLVEIVAAGPPGGLSLSELSRTLETSKSSTLALARTLVAFGYLRDAHPGPGYTLGTGLIRLGDFAGRQLPLGEGRGRAAVDPHFARRGKVHGARQIQQRALAASATPEQRRDRARLQTERHVT